MTDATVAGRDDLALDQHQKQIVEHASGSLLVLGGPGTGKTTCLSERFISLVASGACTPDRILFLVPNRTQKMEIQRALTERLLLEEGLDALIEVPVYTWHGLAYHLVSRHYDRLGYPEPPVLLTSPEQWGAIRDALRKEDPSGWPSHAHLLDNRGFVDEVVDFFIRVGQRAMDQSELEPLARFRPAWAPIVRFYRQHHTALRQRSRVDYPTLMRDAVELVANFDDVRTALQDRFPHILVDDGQELALVQQRLLHFLTSVDARSAGRSLVLAGDPDSSIETFRGAEPEWLDDFDKIFGDHQQVLLETSYRLGPELGDASLALIAGNGERTHRASRFAGASDLEVKRFPNLAAEAEAVARAIRMAHLQEGIPFERMAILLTSPRSMLPPLERALDALQVPFSIAAPDRPLGREPIIRAIADLARFAFDPERDDELVLRLLRSPLIDLDDGTVREMERVARLMARSLVDVVADPEDAAVDDEAAAKLHELMTLRRTLGARKDAPADEAFWHLWSVSTFCKELVERARQDLEDPANRELDALVAFSHALGRFVERRRGEGTLDEYLRSMDRADFGSDPWLPPERSSGGVQVLSFHGAKGKEWDLVAVCGVVEGSIPKGRRATGLFDPYFLDETDPLARSRKNEMEDRRVFYVALTRASRHCLVTTSPGPSRRGEPSRFLQELTGVEPEVEAVSDEIPLTFDEAAARHRRTLSNPDAPAAERVAALIALGEICELDPGCDAAQPSQWWWRWDWTEGDIPIRVQQADKDDDLPLTKLRTSYSRISTYDNCALQYLFSVVLGLDPESSHNMAFGSWIHKIFEEMETGVIKNWDDLRARYDELFDDSVFPNKAIARQFRKDGQIILERYTKHLDPGGAAAAEVSFRVELEGHRITGRIDRVDVRRDGKLVITDYKTSRNPVHWNDAKESLQLAIYHLAATSDPDLASLGEPGLMQLVYPAASMSRGEVATRRQTPEEAVKAIERLPALMEGVLAEDFRPNPEADCYFCKFKPLCPLWTEGKELTS